MDSRTDDIISRFRASWEQTENWFVRFAAQQEALNPLLDLIRQLKSKGMNEYFRIGSSMYTLLISRSMEYGLRPDQKAVWVRLSEEGGFEVTLKDQFKKYGTYRVRDLNDPEVIGLLRTLQDTQVD